MLRSVGLVRARAGVRALSSAVGESGKLNVRGVDIFYRKNGNAGLPLLCMPGAMGELTRPDRKLRA